LFFSRIKPNSVVGLVQDILKAIIKDAYSELDNNDIFNIENEEEINIKQENNSKLYFKYFKILY
jgi:hypothetical protein